MQPEYAEWWFYNLLLLAKLFGEHNLFVDDECQHLVIIENYPLPPNWRPSTSRLRIDLPPLDQLVYRQPDRFYLNKGLRLANGRSPAHYFEGTGFNDISTEGWARYSFHVNYSSWHPLPYPPYGTTFVEVLDALDSSLTEVAEG